jgi:hypothetical protein
MIKQNNVKQGKKATQYPISHEKVVSYITKRSTVKSRVVKPTAKMKSSLKTYRPTLPQQHNQQPFPLASCMCAARWVETVRIQVVILYEQSIDF